MRERHLAKIEEEKIKSLRQILKKWLTYQAEGRGKLEERRDGGYPIFQKIQELLRKRGTPRRDGGYKGREHLRILVQVASLQGLPEGDK